jgi:hypothetical protein
VTSRRATIRRDPKRVLPWLAATALALVALFGVLRSAHAEGGAPLLPHLVADPPDAQSIAIDTSTGTPRLLLRFNGYIHNKGPGAVDFRGEREAPKVTKQVTEEVEKAHAKEEGLPQKVEEELAVPKMNVVQRLFTTNVGQEETNVERAHVNEPSAGELIYASADGHHHWHLQHVAKYSLWNVAKNAEVAPAMKVGFCLDDSQHIEPGVGPSSAVYADNVPPFREFCKKYWPNATSLFEGISPGWRDVYDSSLTFQWVDISNVLPGEYWLREDVNPLGFVKELGGEKVPVYATSPTIISGYDAVPQAASAPPGVGIGITLHSKQFGKPGAAAVYKIVSPPAHGTLGAISGGTVTYTPAPGYSGPDSFTFEASDPTSEFPRAPAVASVAINWSGVAIGTAPSGMTAGTSAPLSAIVASPAADVEWSASAGTVKPTEPQGLNATYTAPAQPGTVTITAHLAGEPALSDSRTITITPVPAPQPAPEVPLAGVATHRLASGLSRPRAMIYGHQLVLTTFAYQAGKVRLSAYVGKSRLGTCSGRTPGNRRFTCRIRLRSNGLLHARIRVVASLRAGRKLIVIALPARRIPRMTMTPAGKLHTSGHAASDAAVYWCSPSTLVATLSGEE